MFILDPTIEPTIEIIGSNLNQVANFTSTTGEAYIRVFGNEQNSNIAYSMGCSNADDNTPIFVIGEIVSNPFGIAPDIVIRDHQLCLGTKQPQPGYALTLDGSAYVSGNIYASNLTSSAFTDTTNANNITSGTLPTARFPESGVSSGVYGESNLVPKITVDSKGRITSIETIEIVGAGDLADVAFTGDYNSLSNITFSLTSLSNAVYTAGNVGIGTTIPLSQLHVTKQARMNSVMTSLIQPDATGLENFITASADVNVDGAVCASGLQVANTIHLTLTDDGNGKYTNVDYSATDVRFCVQPWGETYILSNVGIGTTTPQYPLHVLGEAYATSFVGIGSNLNLLNATNISTGTLAKERLPTVFNVATSAQTITIDATGNVGIGTGIPDARLHVQGDIYASGTLTAKDLVVFGDTTVLNTTSSNTEQMVITNAGTGPALKVIQSGVNTVAEFYDSDVVGGVPNLIIANGGNVGLGTLSPERTLHVIGDVFATGTLVANIDASSINSGTLSNARLPSAIAVASVAGDGASLSNLNANYISSGTISNARLPSAISVSSLAGDGASVSNLNASYVTTGTLDNARLPSAIAVSSLSGDGASLSNLHATYITSGTIDNARLPSTISVSTLAGDGASLSNLNASSITSGTLNNARLPSTISVSSFSGDGASISNLNASFITSGVLDNARLPTTISVSSLSGDGSQLSNLNASSISSGTLSNARLPPALNIQTANPTITVLSDGNVGVGTTSPSASFHVAGMLNTGTGFLQTLSANRAVNVVGTESIVSIVRYGGQDPAMEMKRYNVAGTSLQSYWDIYTTNDDDFRIRRRTAGTTTEDAVIIDASKNIGIGTVTPLQRLHVQGSTYVQSTVFTSNVSGNAYSLSNLNASYLSTGTISNARLPSAFNVNTSSQSFTIDGSGNVGIATSTPLTKLHVEGALTVNNTGAGPTIKVVQTGNEALAEFYDADISSSVPRIVIANNGNIGIGTTTPSYPLQVENDVYFTRVFTTEFKMTSDANLKTNVQTIENAIGIVDQLRGVHFEWKENPMRKSIGMIAQEVENVLPELVHDDAHGFKSISYGNMIGLLIEAVKQQQKQIQELQNTVRDLISQRE